MAVDISLRLAMLVLIEKNQFGTRAQKGKVSRLQKFVTDFEEYADYFSRNFGMETLDGINARLAMHGVFIEDNNKKVFK